MGGFSSFNLNKLEDWKLKKILQNSVKIEDFLTLRGVYRKKRSYQLKRQSYLFTSEYSQNQNPWEFYLEPLKKENTKVQIFWVPTKFGGKESGYFYIKSLNGEPFLINKSYANEAILQYGDIIELNYYELCFYKKETFEGDDSEFNEYDSKYLKACLKSELPVLIEGETGTGKSRFAHKIHENSKSEGRFVHLNLSSFSPGLLESELFGHKKGSFTGAVNDKHGAFYSANRGTLFLDEIDSLTPELQVKLLIFLDNNKFRPVGSNLDQVVDTRVIFASGSPLKELVAKKRMRDDFFYRLNTGFKFELKKLREDTNLIEDFLDHFSIEKGVYIDPSLKDFYKGRMWPGNYRQLKSHLNLKCELAPGKRLEFDEVDNGLLALPERYQSHHDVIPLNTVKKDYMNWVLKRVGGNIQLGAELLEVSPITLKKVV